MKKNKEKIIEGYRRKIALAQEAANFEKVSDLSILLAQKLRGSGKIDEAFEEYTGVVERYGDDREKSVEENKDVIFALRALAEMSSEAGDEERCKNFLGKFENLVKDLPTEHQLMLTVGAECMAKLYSFARENARMEQLLQRGWEYGEKSLLMLHEFIEDKKTMERVSVKIRQYDCHRVVYQIAGYQEKQEEAKKHSEDAYEHAGNDKMRFEIIRMGIDFSWSNKVKESLWLCQLADSMKSRQVEAHLCLVEAYFDKGEMKKGIEALFEIRESDVNDPASAEDDDRERYIECMKFGYKYSERNKRLEKSKSDNDRKGQYDQLDALGDLFLDADYNRIAFEYYKAALELAPKKHRRNALVSCAETADELKMFKDAERYCDQVRKEEADLGEDISEAKYRLFELRLRGNLFDSDATVRTEIGKLEQEGNSFMHVVYRAAVDHYNKNGMEEESNHFGNLEKEVLEANKQEVCNKVDEDKIILPRIPDDIDTMSNDRIMEIMRDQANQFAKKKALAAEDRNVNQRDLSDGDSPRSSSEKKGTRGARRSQRKSGGGRPSDEYEVATRKVSSRRKREHKDNKRKMKEKMDEDIFNPSDDEPLVKSSPARKKQKRAIASSDSEEEKREERESTKENRRSMDSNAACFGLGEKEEEEKVKKSPLSESRNATNGGGRQSTKLSGADNLLQNRKGRELSTETAEENGPSNIPDLQIKTEGSEHKRRREEPECRQRETGPIVQSKVEPPHPIDSFREHDYAAASPIINNSAESLTSAIVDCIAVKVVVVREGKEPEKPILRRVPRDTDIDDLHKHIAALDGEACEWTFQGSTVDGPYSLGDLSVDFGERVLEFECRIKSQRVQKTLVEKFESRCDVSDRAGALSAVLCEFETSRFPSLIFDDLSKYSEKTLNALCEVIDSYANEKMKEDGSWRTENVQIQHFNVHALFLRTLIKLRPETLSLRYCELNDEKLEEMTKEMLTTDLTSLKTLDLSFNRQISSSESLAKFIRRLEGLKTAILQGLDDVEDGIDLMKALRELPLDSLNLDENPWLDDRCMQEFMNENKQHLSHLKLSKVAIHTMNWMEDPDSFEFLKSLNLSENLCITRKGWERIAGFIWSSYALKTLDLNGCAVRTMVLEALVNRSFDAPNLTVTLTKCSGVTASEMIRIFGPLVGGEGNIPNLKVLIESEKVDEVRATSPDLASKVLETAV